MAKARPTELLRLVSSEDDDCPERRQQRPFARLLLAAIVLTVTGGGAYPSPRSQAVRRLAEADRLRVEHDLARANAARDLAAAQAQAARFADQRARQAGSLRVVEAGVLAATGRLEAASAAQAQADAALASHQASFALLIPLMLRLQRYPAETVLAVPAPPGQAIEGLLVTRGLATELNSEAAALRGQQEAAAAARLATQRQTRLLDAQRAIQAARSAELDGAVAEARLQVSQAEAATRDAAQAIEAAAAQAQTLRGAIAAMDSAQGQAVARAAREAALADRERRPQEAGAARLRQAALARPAGPALSQAVGRLVPPVAGRMLQAFGTPAEDGPATGITFATAPAAYVSSPCAGRVAFAAPFRSYGRLLILECGGGYDVVLAGLGRIDTVTGHTTRAGEPLGRMPFGTARPSLYVELRSAGQPVDPTPFLQAKV